MARPASPRTAKTVQDPSLEADNGSTSLGDNLKRLRALRGWTLAEVSARSGLGHSSLWKVENHQMSLTYDKLSLLAKGLEVPISGLFTADAPALATGRRAVSRKGEGSVLRTGHGVYVYPCTDLRDRSMTPMITDIAASDMTEFGPWSRHPGEEYVFVVKGPVVFASEFYEPLHLETGDSLYYDSSMGHAFLKVGSEAAQILSVCVGGAAEKADPQSRTSG